MATAAVTDIASNENLKSIGASCMDLALHGEQLCKQGDCWTGVQYFEAAIQVGTEDLKTLSAVYSQLGNAYFYLQEYEKALEFHRHDLTLARTLNDKMGEAKASGNLGNTLKVLGKFDESIFCCTRHLDISREVKDEIGEARALYNLGNVYHAKGKHLGRSRHRDPGDFPMEVQIPLERAVEFYEANLVLVNKLGDKAAEGRAFGNLGNTHYLLGNFDKAVQYHEERLLVARELNDTSAERRAFSNLGNAHVFLGEFEIAVEYYKKTRELATQLNDKAIEAQACYSLGNTFTLLKKYKYAVDYHLQHLEFAKELNDRVGEGRAYWSLGNAYTALGDHKEALSYAERHLVISKEVGDRTGELTAEMNIVDLKSVLGINLKRRKTSSQVLSTSEVQKIFSADNKGSNEEADTQDIQLSLNGDCVKRRNSLSSLHDGPDDDFLDLLCRSQSSRIDDQRCEFPFPKSLKNEKNNINNSTPAKVKPIKKQKASENESNVPDDAFLDMLMRCQSARIDDQRCEFPPIPRGPTVPDEDFFNLIVRLQSKRINGQRVSFSDRKLSC